MTIIKTSKLTGAALNHAVHLALGLGYRRDEKYGPMYFRSSQAPGVIAWGNSPSPYSTDWSQGGPIIEREKIRLDIDVESLEWYADVNQTPGCWLYSGPTPLIAAMRCFVASKLGDEVDVSEELT